MITDELLSKYGEILTQLEIIDAVEIAATRTLRQSFGVPFAVQMNPTPKVIMIPQHGESLELSPAKVGKKIRRQIAFQIERELTIRQALAESRQLKSLRGMVVPGIIKGMSDSGNLLVEMELEDEFQRLILMGVCPVRFQPRHERQSYFIGMERYWFVTTVLPIVSQRNAMVLVKVSRSSASLPAILLRKHSGMDRIVCIKRIPGAYSCIVTASRIPKTHINTVGKELREKLYVQIVP